MTDDIESSLTPDILFCDNSGHSSVHYVQTVCFCVVIEIWSVSSHRILECTVYTVPDDSTICQWCVQGLRGVNLSGAIPEVANSIGRLGVVVEVSTKGSLVNSKVQNY